MANRRLFTILLLAWTIGLGFIQAGVRPVYVLREESVPACSAGCTTEQQEAARENCLAVCMVWCAMPGFSAVSESEASAWGPVGKGCALEFDHFQGLTRNMPPLLPPP